MSDPVQLERKGAVAVLALDRPDAFNALSSELLAALLARVREVEADTAVRAVVVTGRGRAFSAGADIQEMRHLDAAGAEAFSRAGHCALAALESLAVPTLAAVNGYALGGGCELACACDWIYASTRASFGQPEVGLGLIPGFGGTSRLPRRVGIAWAKELVLTGARIDAETAQRIGLANRLFEPDALLDAALRAAEQIAGCGPAAVAAAKRVLQEGQGADLRVAHALEQTAFGVVFATSDRAEGLAAFTEKRKPVFQGK